MKYYLKKCWPTVTAASICMVVAYGLQVCTSLVQIQITRDCWTVICGLSPFGSFFFC